MIGVWIVKVLSISEYSDTVRSITRLSHVLRGEQAKSTLEFFFFLYTCLSFVCQSKYALLHVWGMGT